VVDLRSAIVASSASIASVLALRIETIDLRQSCPAEAAQQRTLSGSESSTYLVQRVKKELSPVDPTTGTRWRGPKLEDAQDRTVRLPSKIQACDPDETTATQAIEKEDNTSA
jgi:hypothetical protein